MVGQNGSVSSVDFTEACTRLLINSLQEFYDNYQKSYSINIKKYPTISLPRTPGTIHVIPNDIRNILDHDIRKNYFHLLYSNTVLSTCINPLEVLRVCYKA